MAVCNLASLLQRLTMLIFGIALLLYPTPAKPIDDPSLNYRSIATPHFYIHYDSELEALGQRVAQLAEEAHQALSPILDWEPRSRTHIVVVDKLDSANGFARVYGRNFITIYGMPPHAESVLGHYEDWLRILVFHEYVHILHLDTNPGIPQIVNRFIGKQFHPNQVLPKWYTEGLATYQESALTGTGRVNHALFKMWLRAAALDDIFFSLGQASGLPQQWPGGTTAYLYGGFFLDYIAQHHGDSFFSKFNHIYGGRIIPFSLNRTSRSISGRSFDEWWRDWMQSVHDDALSTRDAIRSIGQTSLEYYTHDGGRNTFPRIHPIHPNFGFYHSDFHSQGGFAIISPGQSHPIKKFPLRGISGPINWSPDGHYIIYSQTNIIDNIYSYQDLFIRHIDTGETRQLTHGERAREAVISPDGKHIAYVRARQGTMELVIRATDPNYTKVGAPQIILSGIDWPIDHPRYWHQISMPQWTHDGQHIVYSAWRGDLGRRDLWIYKLDGEHEPEPLTQSLYHEMDPHIGADGLLYYAADNNGIFNIYAMDMESRQSWQISNVVNGVFSPQLSHNGQWIYVSSYTSDGYEIARFRKPTRFYHSAQTVHSMEQLATHQKSAASDQRQQYASTPYQPWRWLAPQTLTPDLAIFSGANAFAATIEGNDPVGHHSYLFNLGWTGSNNHFERHQTSLGINYRYGALPFDISITGLINDYPRFQGMFAQNENIPYLDRQYASRLRLSLPLRFLEQSVALSAAFQLHYTTPLEIPEIVHDPGDSPPSMPQSQWHNDINIGLSYSRLERYSHSVSIEKGFATSLGLTVHNTAIGADYNALSLNYGVDGFLPVPIADAHVIAMQVRGAISQSQSNRPRRFTLGGHSPQDILNRIIFQDPYRAVVIPGYPPNLMQGKQYQLWKFDYRFPILRIDKGYSTLPVFIEQLKGSLFTDIGTAFDGYINDAVFRRSIGAEMQFDTLLGYGARNSFRLGYARGLDDDGMSEWYFHFGGSY